MEEAKRPDGHPEVAHDVDRHRRLVLEKDDPDGGAPLPDAGPPKVTVPFDISKYKSVTFWGKLSSGALLPPFPLMEWQPRQCSW